MTFEDLVEQILETWRKNNEILLYLLDEIPKKGFSVKPSGSRGRDVAAQFHHLNRVRLGWLHYHAKGGKPPLDRYDKNKPPTKAQLKKALKASGLGVEKFVQKSLQSDTPPRLFHKNAVRWMGYLLAHDAHHRGQVLLALKQAGMRIPDRVAVQGVWGKWLYGK
jgi:uncharacterized damage-inducible protein DinB